MLFCQKRLSSKLAGKESLHFRKPKEKIMTDRIRLDLSLSTSAQDLLEEIALENENFDLKEKVERKALQEEVAIKHNEKIASLEEENAALRSQLED